MKLNTQVSGIKSRTDELALLQYSVGSDSLIAYFDVTTQVAGEDLGKVHDTSTPLMIPLEEIAEALDIIYQKAFELRAKQLANLAQNSVVVNEPNYKGFYSELLTTELFAITRQTADVDLQVNTAYTDFAIALTNALVGNENTIALQVSLNKMLKVLEKNIQSSHLQSLDGLIKKHNLPILRLLESSG